MTIIVIFITIFIIILTFILNKKNKFSSKEITRIAIAVALWIVLDIFPVYRFPHGGSVTLGKMTIIFLLANIIGVPKTLFAGSLIGLINFILNPFIVHPIQVLLDYPLACMVLSLSGFFPKKKFIGSSIAILGKFFFHFLSGILFFSSYAPLGVSACYYSFYINGLFMSVEGGIAIIIYLLLPESFYTSIKIKT